MSGDLKVGVVGTGHLGRHHARIAGSMDGVEMVGVFDQNEEAMRKVASEHGLVCHASLDALAEQVDAMVVATPTVSHASICKDLLGRGLHVMVEKPIASTLDEADEMIALAGDRILAVGHVEFYNPAVQELLNKRLPVRFAQFERLAGFSPRSLDIDVVLDLMIHDLQILHALDDSKVREVRATGVNVLTDRVDMATVRLELESGCVASMTASRVSSEKLRKCRLFLPSRYYSLDYQEQAIKGYRLQEIDGRREIRPEVFEIETAEPLRSELEGFFAACQGQDVPYVSGAAGRRALKTALSVAEAIAA